MTALKMGCHSDPEQSEGEESRSDFFAAVSPTQGKIPRYARNDISWLLGARQQRGINDCLEIRCHSSHYSARRDSDGEIQPARMAGIKEAMSAANASARIAAKITAGLYGSSP